MALERQRFPLDSSFDRMALWEGTTGHLVMLRVDYIGRMVWFQAIGDPLEMRTVANSNINKIARLLSRGRVIGGLFYLITK